jgi:hypothetical protein
MTDSTASAAWYRVSATTTATASPTYRTSSTASGRWSGMTVSSVTGHAVGSGPYSPMRSSPENAATTPGCASAGATSTLSIRACAVGLRRTAMCSRPGTVRLSV